jgi:hypothetical protein
MDGGHPDSILRKNFEKATDNRNREGVGNEKRPPLARPKLNRQTEQQCSRLCFFSAVTRCNNNPVVNNPQLLPQA